MDMLLGIVKAVLALALVAECLARAGIAVGVFLAGPAGYPRPVRAGAGILLGVVVFGTAIAGLALAGILFPPCAIALGLAMAASSLGRCGCRPCLLGLAGELGSAGVPGVIAALAGLAPAWRDLLVPETGYDSLAYHLGIPSQSLLAHRAVLEWVPGSFFLPSPLEMLFVFPVIAGDDRVAKWIVALCFLAMNAVCLGLFAAGRGRKTAWLGPLLVASALLTHLTLGGSKNDAVAAAMMVSGVLLYLHGYRRLGCVMAGSCCGVKPVCFPLVLAWVAIASRSLRAVALTVASAAASVLPWMMRSVLSVGDPAFPFLSTWLGTGLWDARNDAALRTYLGSLRDPEAAGLAGIPAAFAGSLARQSLLLPLLIPLAMFWRRRLHVIACIAGLFVTFWMGQMERYLLPGIWLFMALAAMQVGEMKDGRRRIVSLLLGAYCLFVVGYRTAGRAGVGDIRENTGAYRTRALTTFWQAVSGGGIAASARVLSVGDHRTYPFAARVVHGGFFGETPVIWKVVNESSGPERVAVKVRQLGVQTLLYNYVSADWLAVRYRAFRWDGRMLGIYTEYCRRYLHAAARTGRDHSNGGFYVYEIRRARNRVPEGQWFLPGTESVYAKALSLEGSGKYAEALAEYKAVSRLLPGVGSARSMVGHGYALMGDLRNAARYLGPGPGKNRGIDSVQGGQ